MDAEFTIVEATEQSLGEFIPLLERVGSWLWEKGVKHWAPGTFVENRARLQRDAEDGCLILAYRDDELVGGCILSNVNPGWPDSEAAMYLNALAVARSAAGKGLGREIVDACAEAVCRKGKRLIRLDCWDGNSFLKAFYQEAGFRMLDAAPWKDHFLRPFEKDVSSS